MFKSIAVAARDRERMGEVLGVAARFGLDSLLVRLGLQDGAAGAQPDDLPARTRRALEALGPTYVKLGQILATRGDLLPEAWVLEFEKLQSEAPRLDFETLRGDVEAALGCSPEAAFARFDTEPLAAASIAQVHRARLLDGTEVAVKIRRPVIGERMNADMRLLRHFAGLLEANSEELRRLRPRAMVEQLGGEILEELDFTTEGRNADLLRADVSGLDDVVIPRIHWPLTSPGLLVMDFIEGVPPRDPAVLRAAGIDPERIAALGAKLVLDMVLVNGRFHADPHPGNLLCLPGNHLALLDLGSVGFVSPRRQHEFLTFILSLRSGDPGGVTDALMAWNEGSGASRKSVERAAERLVARHGSGPLVLSGMVADFFPLLREQGLVLPPDLVLIFKAMVTMDGVLSRIEPGFDLSHALQAMRGKLLANRIGRLAEPGRSEALMLELSRAAEDLPGLLRAARRKLDEPAAPADHLALAGAVRFCGAAITAGLVLLAAVQLAGLLH